MQKIKLNTNNNLTFSDGFEEFIDNCKSRNLREATIKHYKEGYKSITRFIDKDMEIQSINKSTVENFTIDMVENLNASSQTIHTYARDLKTMLYFFMNMGYMESFKIQLPKVDKKPVETYTDDELRILLKKPNLKKSTFTEYRTWVVINFLLSTGVRMSSLINIKIKDLDFDNEVVYISHTKNRKALIIPLNSTILKIFKEYLKHRQGSPGDYLFCNTYGKVIDKRTMNGAIIKYNKDRGKTTTGVHRYRHTYSKKFILAGESITVLQKILGHSNLSITENYINLLVTDIKKEMNKVNLLEQFNNTNHIKL